MTEKRRSIGPEDEDRRTDNPAATTTRPLERGQRKRGDRRAQQDAKEAGVESLPDGERAAEDEAAKARDD